VKKENWKDPRARSNSYRCSSAKTTAIETGRPLHYELPGNCWSDLVCLLRLTAQAESEQAAAVYLYCARVYIDDTLVLARTTAVSARPLQER